MKYTTAAAWQEAAMLRQGGLSATEIAQRRAQAKLHYAQAATLPDAHTLADHELYILGKMEMPEYEQYLLFKHSQQAT